MLVFLCSYFIFQPKFVKSLFFVEKPSKVQVIPIEKYDFSCYD